MNVLAHNLLKALVVIAFIISVSCSTGNTDANNAIGDYNTQSQNQTNNEGERASQSQNSTSKATHHFPDAIGYVNDFDDILTAKETNFLTRVISTHEAETTNEIALAIIPDFATYNNIDDLSYDLSNFWGIGKKDKDNGVLIVFCKKEQKVRISTGYGLETLLTNTEAKNIINNVMTPEFTSGEYFKGLHKGLNAIIAELKKGE